MPKVLCSAATALLQRPLAPMMASLTAGNSASSHGEAASGCVTSEGVADSTSVLAGAGASASHAEEATGAAMGRVTGEERAAREAVPVAVRPDAASGSVAG